MRKYAVNWSVLLFPTCHDDSSESIKVLHFFVSHGWFFLPSSSACMYLLASGDDSMLVCKSDYKLESEG
jgi:hypothetical protein